jgi:hypothetical protein
MMKRLQQAVSEMRPLTRRRKFATIMVLRAKLWARVGGNGLKLDQNKSDQLAVFTVIHAP